MSRGKTFSDFAKAKASYEALGRRHAALLTDDSFAPLKYWGVLRALTPAIVEDFRSWWTQNKVLFLRPTEVVDGVRATPTADTPSRGMASRKRLDSMGNMGVIKNIEKWKRGEKIGSGSAGVVFKAQDCATGHLFVVKENRSTTKMKYKEMLQSELDICKDLEHPNIVRCLGHEYEDDVLHVYLEYVPGGSLRGMLVEFGALEEEVILVGMKGLLEGLEYLHTRSPMIVHRDIKSANVLVNHEFVLKLADFGCSKLVDVDDMTTSFTTVGSVLWMAPEVIRSGTEGYGRKADIWSLGCVFIEMATAEMPWENRFDNVWAAMHHINQTEESPQVPTTLSESLRNLIGSCVQRNPANRPWASELKQSYLFDDVYFADLLSSFRSEQGPARSHGYPH